MTKGELINLIIAYYPEREALIGWSKAVQQGVPLRIWDNTPGGCKFKEDFPDLIFLSKGVNLGVGPALRELLNELHQEGLWDKALYWDQDAQWTYQTYQWALALHRKFPAELDSNNKILLNLRAEVSGGNFTPGLVPTRLMMNNGMVLPVRQGMDLLSSFTPYFMECADYQICYRANLQGWKLMTAYGCPELQHDPTRPSLVWSKGSRTYHKRIYPKGRSSQFLLNLGALALDALRRRNIPYLRIFLRNILTHLAYRAWFNGLWYLRPSGRRTPNTEL